MTSYQCDYSWVDYGKSLAHSLSIRFWVSGQPRAFLMKKPASTQKFCLFAVISMKSLLSQYWPTNAQLQGWDTRRRFSWHGGFREEGCPESDVTLRQPLLSPTNACSSTVNQAFRLHPSLPLLQLYNIELLITYPVNTREP